jgi:glycosyltransferase involved in cell wall biosynthesis
MTHASVLGELTVSMLRGEQGRQVASLDQLATWLAASGPTDIVALATGLLVGLARRVRQTTGARIVCTLQGEDAFLDSLPQPHRDEAWATMAQHAADVDAFVAVSHYYAEVMTRRLHLSADRVHVVHNGIDLEGFEPAAQPPAPPVLGYLARMCRDKGLHTLVEAYLLLRERGRVDNLRLSIAGARTRADAPFVEALRRRLAAAGLSGNVTFLENIDRDRKLQFLRDLSVLSVPATYGEAFGLYVLEALACGVPVVQPRHGAFAELLEITGGGTLCEPHDAPTLARAIESVLTNLESARADASRARGVVAERFSAARMASGVANVCDAVLRERI